MTEAETVALLSELGRLRQRVAELEQLVDHHRRVVRSCERDYKARLANTEAKLENTEANLKAQVAALTSQAGLVADARQEGKVEGAREAVRIVRSKCLPHLHAPAYIMALEDVIVSLEAYLARGCRPATSTFMDSQSQARRLAGEED
jgi:cell division septum initiation protein DivIVA